MLQTVALSLAGFVARAQRHLRLHDLRSDALAVDHIKSKRAGEDHISSQSLGSVDGLLPQGDARSCSVPLCCCSDYPLQEVQKHGNTAPKAGYGVCLPQRGGAWSRGGERGSGTPTLNVWVSMGCMVTSCADSPAGISSTESVKNTGCTK